MVNTFAVKSVSFCGPIIGLGNVYISSSLSPTAFVAVTLHLTTYPTYFKDLKVFHSSSSKNNVLLSLPPMFDQLYPDWLYGDFCHWYLNDVGEFSHTPFDTATISYAAYQNAPFCSERIGNSVFFGFKLSKDFHSDPSQIYAALDSFHVEPS